MRVEDKRYKHTLAILIICIIPPFLFTQSRSSYLALIPVVFVFGILTRRKIIFLGLIITSLLVSPLFLPTVVKQRIMFTFEQPEESGQITIGDIHLDTSTSARVTSWKSALQAWLEHPVLGYGVTGYRFIDAQYPRVLVETGILGLMAFFYLIFTIFRLALHNVKEIKTPYFKGLSIGFLAGFIGLLVHAIGANTFIIVRIMEPFWFFAGIITVLPTLEQQSATQVETVDIQRPKFVPSS
jgi:O-antigen ligase